MLWRYRRGCGSPVSLVRVKVSSFWSVIRWSKKSFMNRIFRQDERLGRLTTVMGPNLLVLMRFNGSDQVNGLFEY